MAMRSGPPRRKFWQWLLLPIRWLINRLFDAHTAIPLIVACVLMGALTLYFGIGLVGISQRQVLALVGAPPPTPPSSAAPLLAPSYTCTEQTMMRAEWKVFATGLRSSAPRPWKGKPPADGLFFIRNGEARGNAERAIELLGSGAGNLQEAERLLQQASGSLLDNDRSIVQFHRGLVLFRRGLPKEAARQFEGVEKALKDGRSKATTDEDRIGLAGVEVANLHAWGVALMAYNPEAAAEKLEAALAAANLPTNAGLLKAGGDRRTSLYWLQERTMVDLHVGEIYTDALAANLRVLAQAKCGDPAYLAAIGRLRVMIKTFLANPATDEWPALTANLQLAGALLGDSVFVRQFRSPDGGDAEVAASQAARTAVAAPPGDDLVGEEGYAGGVASPMGDQWARFRKWRDYFREGEAAKLYVEVRAAKARADRGGDRESYDVARTWLDDVINQALKAEGASEVDKRRIWSTYGDLTGGGNAELQAPFGLKVGFALLALLALLYCAVVITLFGVRNAYVRMYVSEHRRERLG